MKAPRSSGEPDHEQILLFCSRIPNLSQMAPELFAELITAGVGVLVW